MSTVFILLFRSVFLELRHRNEWKCKVLHQELNYCCSISQSKKDNKLLFNFITIIHIPSSSLMIITTVNAAMLWNSTQNIWDCFLGVTVSVILLANHTLIYLPTAKCWTALLRTRIQNILFYITRCHSFCYLPYSTLFLRLTPLNCLIENHQFI